MKKFFSRNKIFRNSISVVFARESWSQVSVTSAYAKPTFQNQERGVLPGWYLVKAKNDFQAQAVSLYLDKGQGIEKGSSRALNMYRGLIRQSLLFIPEHIQGVHLYCIGKINNHKEIILLFKPICKFEALLRASYFLYNENRKRGISISQIFQEKWHQIRQLGVINVFQDLDRFIHYENTDRPNSYKEWLLQRELQVALTGDVLSKHNFVKSPLISVCCWVPPDSGLKQISATLDSLMHQAYDNWHFLIILDGKGPSEEEVRCQLLSHGDNVSIISRFHEECQKVYSAISHMPGEFGIWMKPGERLSPFALAHFVKAINRQPDKAVWYCDLDQIDEKFQRKNPFFRPSWNRELFYSQQYVEQGCLFHLSTIKRFIDTENLISDAEMYDLLLRLLEKVEDQAIGHIPEVLYHCKDLYLNADIRNIEQQRKALVTHFKRIKQEVRIGPGLLPFTHRVEYNLQNDVPQVTIIIPTRDQFYFLKRCIQSLLKLTIYPFFDILIVDNGSRDSEACSYLRSIINKNIRCLSYDHSFNFAAINNMAVQETGAELVCLLNNDMEVIDGKWLQEMVRYAVMPNIGCVGAKLLYSNKRIQHAGVICGVGDVAGHAHRFSKRHSSGYFGRLQSSQYFSAVTAACLLVRREVFLEVGGMCEELAVAYNDIDFCLRVQQAGYHNVYTPYAELIHHESVSRGNADTPEKKKRYQAEVAYMWQHWRKELENDPYYNPNLTRVREDFSL